MSMTASRNEFWAERSRRCTIGRQNSMTGQWRPAITVVSPTATVLGVTVRRGLAAWATGAPPAVTKSAANTRSVRRTLRGLPHSAQDLHQQGDAGVGVSPPGACA